MGVAKMDLEILLQKHFGLKDNLNSNDGEEAYERMINFIEDLSFVTDKFDRHGVVSDLDNI
jgi:hypothetical protein